MKGPMIVGKVLFRGKNFPPILLNGGMMEINGIKKRKKRQNFLLKKRSIKNLVNVFPTLLICRHFVEMFAAKNSFFGKEKTQPSAPVPSWNHRAPAQLHKPGLGKNEHDLRTESQAKNSNLWWFIKK